MHSTTSKLFKTLTTRPALGSIAFGGVVQRTSFIPFHAKRSIFTDAFKKDQLLGSVDFYKYHLFVPIEGNSFLWPPKIEKMGGLVEKLDQELKHNEHLNNAGIRVTAIEEANSPKKALLFPNRVSISNLKEQDVTQLLEGIVNNNIAKSFAVEALKEDFHIFICCHNNRDKKCGTCGPPLVQRFEDELSKRGLSSSKVAVHRTSHVGGHKYAGNVIIFDHEGVGDWYGYVKEEDVPILIEHMLEGKTYINLWRGRMGLSKEQQIGFASLKGYSG